MTLLTPLLRIAIAALIFVSAIPVTTSRCAGQGVQENHGGKIVGTVKDQQGANISGAEIALVLAYQAAVQTAVTNAAGEFTFELVTPGAYEIRITHTGFAPQRLTTRVTPGASVDVNVVMEVAQLRDNVTVTAETGQAQDKQLVAQQLNIVNEGSIVQRATAVLAQVAEEEVGVSMQRTSPTIGAVLVRGLTEVGVYVDGVRYTNSTQRGGINTFFNLNETDESPLG